MQSVNHLKQLMVAQEKACHYKHTRVAKAYHSGLSTKDNAERHQIKPTSVYGILQRPEVVALLDLMSHYAALWEGPTLQERKRMIWEIAVDNQKTDPRTTLQAHKELNVMEGVGRDANTPTEIKITIDSGTFKPTVLDQ